MTISYPLVMPTTPGFKTSKFDTNAAVGISESPFTYEQQVYVHQGQRFKATLTLPPMRRTLAEPWNAFGLMLNGRQGTFLMGDPDAKRAQGQPTGAPLCSVAGQTGNQLSTTGWTPGVKIFKAGDYFQLGGGSTSRMYKLLADVSSDGGGNANLLFWPNLRAASVFDDPLTTENCMTQWRLDAAWGWTANEVSTYGVTFSATEAL